MDKQIRPAMFRRFLMMKMLIVLSLLTSVFSIFAKPKYIEPLTMETGPEQMPEFPGGQKKLLQFIKSNLKYPDIAREKGVSGTVIVEFLINKEGKIGRTRVVRGIGSGCDEEAVRIIQSTPDWLPGRSYGNPIDVTLTLPIEFVKPIENEELLQFIERDKKIALYTPDQIMDIIRKRENISDSIKILNYKEYRESDSRDYHLYYSFIDYTPQNKYIGNILYNNRAVTHSDRSDYISTDWYPLTFYNGDLYNFKSDHRKPYIFSDSAVYTGWNDNNPFVINELKIIDEDQLRFTVSLRDRKDYVDVYFIDKEHKFAFFILFGRKPQLYADRTEINSFPVLVCVGSQWKAYYTEHERIEEENSKLPSLRGRVKEILNKRH